MSYTKDMWYKYLEGVEKFYNAGFSFQEIADKVYATADLVETTINSQQYKDFVERNKLVKFY